MSVFFLFLFFPSLKGFADARIEGWLPKEESDFIDERGQPAALWHIEYDDQRIGGIASIASTLPAVKHVVKHVKHVGLLNNCRRIGGIASTLPAVKQ